MSDTVAIRLPNGKLQVQQSTNPSLKDRIFESEDAFISALHSINEGAETPNYKILDTILG